MRTGSSGPLAAGSNLILLALATVKSPAHASCSQPCGCSPQSSLSAAVISSHEQLQQAKHAAASVVPAVPLACQLVHSTAPASINHPSARPAPHTSTVAKHCALTLRGCAAQQQGPGRGAAAALPVCAGLHARPPAGRRGALCSGMGQVRRLGLVSTAQLRLYMCTWGGPQRAGKERSSSLVPRVLSGQPQGDFRNSLCLQTAFLETWLWMLCLCRFEIFTISRPSHPLSLAAYPVLRWYQHR